MWMSRKVDLRLCAFPSEARTYSYEGICGLTRSLTVGDGSIPLEEKQKDGGSQWEQCR